MRDMIYFWYKLEVAVIVKDFDFIYGINHLFCIVFEFHRGKPPLSTNQFDEFIKKSQKIVHFQSGSIYPQEVGCQH